MPPVLLAVILFGAAGWSNGSAAPRPDVDRIAHCEALDGAAGPPVTVHGRLYAANGGGSGFRIWLIGTHRVVWLTPRIAPAVPDAVLDVFKPLEQELYGDFTLVPLAPDRPGVMRETCFVSGDRLVVRDTRSGESWRVRR